MEAFSYERGTPVVVLREGATLASKVKVEGSGFRILGMHLGIWVYFLDLSLAFVYIHPDLAVERFSHPLLSLLSLH